MDKIPFEDGTLVKAGYVEIDGNKYETVQPEYTGKTPLSAYNLKKMQDNVENAINDGDLVKKIKISGVSKQETREGYNLVDFSNPTNKLAPYSFENDILVVSSSYQYANINWNLLDLFKTNAGKTVYFKSKEVDSSNAISPTAQLTITNNGTNSYINLFNTLYTIPTDTSNLTKATFGIYCNNSSTDTASSITITEPMLVFEGNAEKPYEQYGASPSIEYEAPVESVGDNINEFDEDNVVTENAYINNDGTTVSTTDWITTTTFIPVQPNTKYIVSATSMGNRFIYSEHTDKIHTSIIGQRIEIAPNTPFTTSSTAKYIRFCTNNANATKFKLEKGTKATPNSPYGQGSIGIVNSTENLLDISKLSSNSKNGVTLTKNDNGIIILNGTASDDANFDFYITDIKATTNHKLQLFNLGGSYTNTYVSLYMATDKTWNDFDMLALTTNKITVMSLKEKTYTYARIKVNKGVVCNNLVIGCQVINDVDGTATEYVEGKSQTKALYTQQPFRAIGDVKDRFIKQNGLWYEEHKINHLVFNGTENWRLDTTKEITQVYKYYNPSLFPQKAVTILSNYFIDKVAGDNEGITVGYGQIYIAVNKTTASTLDDFKAKLTELYNAGKPLYVDYQLATLKKCTPEQVEVLNDIYSAYGEGMTNIICNDEIEPVIEIVKETKETVQSENDKAISALLERVSQLEQLLAQSTAVEEGA